MARSEPLLSLTLPLRTASEANVRRAWQGRHARSQEARGLMVAALRTRAGTEPPALPLGIVLVRRAPAMLDAHDNLRVALKACADGVADWLGTDDRSPELHWAYGQERTKQRVYEVRVELYAAAHVCLRCCGWGWVS